LVPQYTQTANKKNIIVKDIGNKERTIKDVITDIINTPAIK
jgi:hypothetical protein